MMRQIKQFPRAYFHYTVFIMKILLRKLQFLTSCEAKLEKLLAHQSMTVSYGNSFIKLCCCLSQVT